MQDDTLHSMTADDAARLAGSVRIMKLGGSLLEHPNLRSRFEQWLATMPARINLVIVGGGEWVEELRRLDRIHQFNQSWIHERCIDLMQHTAVLAHQLLQLDERIDCQARLESLLQNAVQRSPAPVVAVLSPSAYRRRLPADMPQSWEVTSDSLAACMARQLGDCELILLKSIDPPTDNSTHPAYREWSKRGLVDAYFPSAAAGLSRVQFINLRGS